MSAELYLNTVTYRILIVSFEVDALVCPECQGRMKIIAFIEDHSVIDRIINHLKLNFIAERPPPPQGVQQVLLMSAEDWGKYVTFQKTEVAISREIFSEMSFRVN